MKKIKKQPLKRKGAKNKKAKSRKEVAVPASPRLFKWNDKPVLFV